MRDILVVDDFSHEMFQNAFKQYFDELGIIVKDWEGLFEEITKEGGNKAYIRINDDETIVGFILFRNEIITNWFFEEKVGFIREFWISKGMRSNGHGSHLLKLV